MCCSSILHLCAIAVDRYRAISEPVTYGLSRSLSKSLMTVALIWILSFAVVSPPFIFGWGIVWPDHFDENTPCILPQVRHFCVSMICYLQR